MNIGLIYATKTGHSRKIASALQEPLGVPAQDVKTNPNLENIDLLFVVGGIYGGKSSPALIEYLKKTTSEQVKKAVLVTSSGGKTQGQDEPRAILTSKGVEVIGEFKCQGSFLIFGMGHPNEEDIANAVAFVKKWAA